MVGMIENKIKITLNCIGSVRYKYTKAKITDMIWSFLKAGSFQVSKEYIHAPLMPTLQTICR